MIERYDTFNTKGCPDKLLFGDFHDQPIPPKYYDFLNDENDGNNNILITTVDDSLPVKKVVEDSVIPNDE